jgi:hypothetical protein
MEQGCLKEVIELHRFFEEWFNGVLAATEQEFARLKMALGNGFLLISPAGLRNERESLVDGLRAAHGSHRLDAHPFKIWIKNPNFRSVAADVAIVTYEEWQEIDGRTTARLSSALFRRKANNPNDVEWLHVHETWLPLEDS